MSAVTITVLRLSVSLIIEDAFKDWDRYRVSGSQKLPCFVVTQRLVQSSQNAEKSSKDLDYVSYII